MACTSNTSLRWGLPQVLTALESLAAANSLDGFTRPQNAQSLAFALMWSAKVIDAEVLQLPLQGPAASLLPLLCRTAATALPLISQADTHHKLEVVHGALEMFQKVIHAWCNSCPRQQLLRLRTKICCEVARAGVLPALAQACETAAAALNQQSNLVNMELKQLLYNSGLLVGMWRGLVLTWPQEGWCTSSEQLAGTIAPAASLAYSILQQHSSATEEQLSHATGAGRILALEISTNVVSCVRQAAAAAPPVAATQRTRLR
jgi:hypothetical protein